MNRITESSSLYDELEKKSVAELLTIINQEDQKVALAVKQQIPQITAFVDQLVPRMQDGGRLFYIGAGTSGRLGILDASECPPTFGVPHDWVVGLIAGGDQAIRKAVEHAEDDENQAIKDLDAYHIDTLDAVVGIAASGTTPYVIGGLKAAQARGILTAGITCNPAAQISTFADYPIEVEVGPEVVTGSTRMKSGTAQKLVLNMISTTVMIQLGRVKGNKMVDMQLSNNKLKERAVRMIVEELQITSDKAKHLLQKHQSVRAVINHHKKA